MSRISLSELFRAHLLVLSHEVSSLIIRVGRLIASRATASLAYYPSLALARLRSSPPLLTALFSKAVQVSSGLTGSLINNLVKCQHPTFPVRIRYNLP